VTRLSPMRRGFLAGYRRARAKARKQIHAMAADFDAELVALRDEFRELALAHHRQCVEAAISEASNARWTRICSCTSVRKTSMSSDATVGTGVWGF